MNSCYVYVKNKNVNSVDNLNIYRYKRVFRPAEVNNYVNNVINTGNCNITVLHML